MWSGFAIDYTVLVFFSTLGTMQIVASRNGLAGIMLLPGRPRLSTWLGSGVIAAAFIWFFSSEFRNVPDTAAGLEANTQAATFAIAGGAAVGVTFLLASIVNHRWAIANLLEPATDEAPPGGLDVFRETTFVVAVIRRLRHWSAALRKQEQGRTQEPGRGRGSEADG